MGKLYIPGDLVMTKTAPNNFVPNGVVCEFVSYCNRNKVSVRVAKGIDTFFLEKEEITHIPLTPEILEKNGWKKSKINDCAYFYYKDGLFLTYTSKDGKFWFDDFDYSSSICVDLPYVHSLQHLLFGLGINSEMEV
nr:MAG TPA: hypothetical protein [Caudoviricetes sp.]DAI53826.1 MAG TPA: hypothetical protein [Caudoviricetes sp.]